ncbi:ABC transporter substrate-binding protein [Oscillibacter valericigenes]|uniref:ABC transporter substrate-binding protein n=1 Tax=Oscillibacter valericigenes TaxID=351091 RepID=UPI001F317A04|nr:ABC transporter substrate-binding protein [Oscillibacter valericigenes]MCF2663406.1 ABC transporter substrate-binding protein [Oscillibacter valericigenes]
MKQRLLKTICFLLLPVLLLTGCWQEEPSLLGEGELLQTDQQETEPSGSRVILPELFSLPYAPELTLDPVTCPDGMQQVVASLICEGLFRLGTALEPEPCLCQNYTYDETTYTYVFTLRSGVTFSDGTPLTSDDVKATLDRAGKSERYGSRLSGISQVIAGDTTVTVVLSAPNTGFPALLDVPVVKAGTESSPIGTGPYLLSTESTGTYLVSNQSWWRGSQPTDRIALVEAIDQDTMLYRFTSHDVQLITADLTGTDPISATGSISYCDANTTILQYLGCNVTREPLDTPAFRRALSLGISRQTLVSAFLSGHGTAAQFPVSPVSPLYPEDLEETENHETFFAALKESGYTPDRTLTLLVNEENSFKVSVAEAIADSFSSDGVPMTVKALPWEEYTATLAAGDFDLYYGEVKLTADWDLRSLLSTEGTLNMGGWTDFQTDQLLSAFVSSADRPAAMKQLCTRLREQAPILPICFKSTSVLMQTDVLTGLTPTMAEPFYNLSDCTIQLRES